MIPRVGQAPADEVRPPSSHGESDSILLNLNRSNFRNGDACESDSRLPKGRRGVPPRADSGRAGRLPGKHARRHSQTQRHRASAGRPEDAAEGSSRGSSIGKDVGSEGTQLSDSQAGSRHGRADRSSEFRTKPHRGRAHQRRAGSRRLPVYNPGAVPGDDAVRRSSRAAHRYAARRRRARRAVPGQLCPLGRSRAALRRRIVRRRAG